MGPRAAPVMRVLSGRLAPTGTVRAGLRSRHARIFLAVSMPAATLVEAVIRASDVNKGYARRYSAKVSNGKVAVRRPGLSVGVTMESCWKLHVQRAKHLIGKRAGGIFQRGIMTAAQMDLPTPAGLIHIFVQVRTVRLNRAETSSAASPAVNPVESALPMRPATMECVWFHRRSRMCWSPIV